MILLFGLTAFVTFAESALGALEPYRDLALFVWLALCIPLSLVVAIWGTRFDLVADTG